MTYGHPDTASTNLYLEWPFAALANTDPDLKNRVALALLQTSDSPLAKVHGMTDLWSAPLPYYGVRQLIDALHARLEQPSFAQAVLDRRAIWIVLLLILGAGSAVWWRRSTTKAGMESVPADRQDKAEVAGLTQRERQILALIAQGFSTKEIAIDLGISPKTAEFHRANMLRRLGARTSSQLVAMAS